MGVKWRVPFVKYGWSRGAYFCEIKGPFVRYDWLRLAYALCWIGGDYHLLHWVGAEEHIFMKDGVPAL